MVCPADMTLTPASNQPLTTVHWFDPSMFGFQSANPFFTYTENNVPLGNIYPTPGVPLTQVDLSEGTHIIRVTGSDNALSVFCTFTIDISGKYIHVYTVPSKGCTCRILHVTSL